MPRLGSTRGGIRIVKPQGIILALLLGVMVLVYARAFKRFGSPAGDMAQLTTEGLPTGGGEPLAMTGQLASDGQPLIATGQPASSEEPLMGTGHLASREEQRDYLAHLEWGRDPFSGTSAVGQASEFVLSGILWDPTQPLAIINGTMVGVGEQLEDVFVLEIRQDSVTLTDGMEPFQLHLSP
jgi:hypothetical protein